VREAMELQEIQVLLNFGCHAHGPEARVTVKLLEL
jgi:hypothetical protein